MYVIKNFSLRYQIRSKIQSEGTASKVFWRVKKIRVSPNLVDLSSSKIKKLLTEEMDLKKNQRNKKNSFKFFSQKKINKFLRKRKIPVLFVFISSNINSENWPILLGLSRSTKTLQIVFYFIRLNHLISKVAHFTVDTPL